MKKERGITLVALVVTIIVLLILAGVTIGMATKMLILIMLLKHTKQMAYIMINITGKHTYKYVINQNYLLNMRLPKSIRI